MGFSSIFPKRSAQRAAVGLALAGIPSAVFGESSLVEESLIPVLNKYCADCHGADKQKADVNFDQFSANTKLYEDDRFWNQVAEMLREREMPPEDKPQPSEEERSQAVLAIEAGLTELDCETMARPGRVTARRLNRNEYNNTIRDLMGVDFEPAEDFPADEVGYGFDNIGDVLSLSTVQMEKYLEAAESITSAAIEPDVPEWPNRERHEGEDFATSSDDIRPDRDRYLGLFREGEGWMRVELEEPGDYRLEIRAFGDQAGSEPPRLEVKHNDTSLGKFDVPATSGEPQIETIEVQLAGGKNQISVGYLNNFNENGDRNLYVDYIDLIGPLDAPPPELPESHTRWIPDRPKPGRELEYAREILTKFATRAYRHAATPQEVDQLMSFFEMAVGDGETFDAGVQLAMTAALASPKFLFRWELPEDIGEEPKRALDAYEIASRLSYFLWNSMPDDRLFALAADGSLESPEVVLEQARRMIQDPKGQEFMRNFAGQWLQIRNLETHQPDPELFPEYDDELKSAMRRETELFFEEIVRQDLSVLNLLTGEFTFLNERLARHYGIEGVSGPEFRRVSLPAQSQRRGALTHASVLTLTSNPTRTSPVIRGKWVLEQILGTPPPPPPPNVPELEESEEAAADATLRERLEIHRDKPDCRGCHDKMDPIGFAFENFNAIGKWRDQDGSFPINPAGELASGEQFSNASDLTHILAQKDTFVAALTKNLLTYALGRGLEFYDQCVVDQIVEKLKLNNYKFSSLLEGIILSEAFLFTETGVQNNE